jgi:hypothetical protein
MAVQIGRGKSRDEDSPKKKKPVSRKSREEIFEEEFEASKKGTGGGSDFIQFEEGTSTIRILPPLDEDDPRYFKVVGQHYSAPSGGKGYKPVLCPKVTFGEECPICDLVKNSPKKEKDFRQQHAVRKRYFYNVVLLTTPGKKKFDPVVGIASLGKKAHNQVMGFETDEDYGNLDDLEEGRNLKVTRDGEGLKTEYAILPSPHAKPLSDFVDDVDECLDARTDLDELVQNLSSKESYLEELASDLESELE